MVVDIANARLDLFDVDDFVNSIEREAKLLTERFQKKLDDIKQSKSGLKDFLSSIGAIKRSQEKLINPWVTIGLIDMNIVQKKMGYFKDAATVVEYTTTKKASADGISIPIKSDTTFNRHILLTTNKKTFDRIRKAKGHTSTIVILASTEGGITDTLTYKSVTKVIPTTYHKPKNILNISIQGNKMSTEPVERLHKAIYKDFCIRTETHEFGSTFSELAPTNDKNRDPFISPATSRLPMAIYKCENNVSITNEFSKKINDTNPEMKLSALMKVMNDSGGEGTTTNDDVIAYTKYKEVANRYLRTKPHVFRIETDAILGADMANTIISTLIHNPSKSLITQKTLRKLYATARYNMTYHLGERNVRLENLTPLQNSYVGRLTHINQHHKLELKYHQMFAILNTIPHRVSILKADVGLGKTRASIAYCMTKGGKHNLVITEPGNVLELQREFKEQLNMGDVTKIIKKESDLQNLKQFNLIGYSTLCKILKQSNLKDLPSPNVTLQINSAPTTRQQGNITDTDVERAVIDVTKGFGYWEAFRDEGPSISGKRLESKSKMIVDYVSKKRLKDNIAKLLSETTNIVTNVENVVRREQDIIPTLTQTLKLFETEEAAEAMEDMVAGSMNRRIAEKIKDGDLFPSARDDYSYFSQNIGDISTCYLRASIDNAPDMYINIILMFCGIISALQCASKEDVMEEMRQSYSFFYRSFKDVIEIVLNTALEYKLTKKQKENLPAAFVRLSHGSREQYGCIAFAKGILPALSKMLNVVMPWQTKKTFDKVRRHLPEMQLFVNRAIEQEREISKNRKLANVIEEMHPQIVNQQAGKSLSRTIKMITLILGKMKRDIEHRKTRAKYRVRSMATRLSGKCNTVIADECHNIKNISSTRTMVMTQLKAKNYLFMSATPVGNHMGELLSYLVVGYGPRSLTHMVDLEARRYDKYRMATRPGRKMYSINIDRDAITYEIDITNALSDVTKKGYPLHKLNALVDNNMTRVIRSEKDVVQDQSFQFDVKEYRSFSVPSEEHMALYAAQMEIVYEAATTGKYEDTREALSTLTNLIKISEIPHLISDQFDGFLTNKQNDIVNMGKEYLDQNRSVIIFTQFQEMVQIIAKELSTRTGKNVYMLHDKLTPDKRFKLIDTFRKQSDNACIVGTVNNLGKGFNLACADVVIMSDVPWSPLLYAQSIGRILRPDQTGNPEVIMVMNKYMIDMYKFDTIRAKLNMIKKYIDRDETVAEEDTHKVDYKRFLLGLLNKAITDGVMADPGLESNHTQLSGGV